MGAYSSWAMLALTHHCVVQIAASRVGYESVFTDYAVLGDDIVIGDSAVGKVYLSIMRDTLGVEINLSKSLVCKDTCEFAKRLYHFQMDISPLGTGLILGCVRGIGLHPTVYQSIPVLSTSVILRLIDEERISRNSRQLIKLSTLAGMAHNLETDRSSFEDAFWQVLGFSEVLPSLLSRLESFMLYKYDVLNDELQEGQANAFIRLRDLVSKANYAGFLSSLWILISPAYHAYSRVLKEREDELDLVNVPARYTMSGFEDDTFSLIYTDFPVSPFKILHDNQEGTKDLKFFKEIVDLFSRTPRNWGYRNSFYPLVPYSGSRQD